MHAWSTAHRDETGAHVIPHFSILFPPSSILHPLLHSHFTLIITQYRRDYGSTGDGDGDGDVDRNGVEAIRSRDRAVFRRSA